MLGLALRLLLLRKTELNTLALLLPCPDPLRRNPCRFVAWPTSSGQRQTSLIRMLRQICVELKGLKQAGSSCGEYPRASMPYPKAFRVLTSRGSQPGRCGCSCGPTFVLAIRNTNTPQIELQEIFLPSVKIFYPSVSARNTGILPVSWFKATGEPLGRTWSPFRATAGVVHRIDEPAWLRSNGAGTGRRKKVGGR
jgi:hypothetical protein